MSRKVSVVIPVYNREEWVSEAIDSVLRQTSGVNQLEVVLIDDGSIDSSPQILDSYAAQYPDVVTVVHQANAGVAAALNAGVAAASGEIVGFLGSDDYLSDDTVQSVLDFYDQYWDEVDLAAIPIFMTGSREGEHWNNSDRFATTRVIDVWKEWNRRQIHGGGTFIKREMFTRHGYAFDPKLRMTEDSTLNTQVIMKKMAYGAISGPRYYNRRYEAGGDSLVSSTHLRKEFYTIIPERAFSRMFQDAQAIHGMIPRYVQAVVAYDLVFRFRQEAQVLDENELQDYTQTVARLLRDIMVPVLMRQRAPIEQRLNMLSLKYGGEFDQVVSYSRGAFSIGKTVIYDYSNKSRGRHRPAACTVQTFESDGSMVRIRGTLRTLRIDKYVNFVVKVGRESFPVSLSAPPRDGSYRLAGRYVAGEQFEIVVPVKPHHNISIVVVVDRPGSARFEAPLELKHGFFSSFSGSRSTGLFKSVPGLVFRQDNNFAISTHAVAGRKCLAAEIGFVRRMLRSGAPRRAAWRRLNALLTRRRNSQEVWLLADHKKEAGDNGEAMFRYLAAHPEHGVHPVLSLSKAAPGVEDLSSLGEVVEPDSRAYFKRFFQASVVLNSAADHYMIDPLGRDRVWLADLLPETSVFLQHGVIKDDLSVWLNRARKAFDVFVTSSREERRSVVEGEYNYSADEVVLTGLPRFDRLEDAAVPLIVFAPTWRRGLVGSLDEKLGRNAPSEDFSASEYFKEWQSVIADPRLNAAMKRAGFRGVLALHPSHSAEIDKYAPGPQIDVAGYPFDYRRLFREGSLLVTDYSSVAFDFAYLRKPVVYLQSDREGFYGGHLYTQGYFSYDDHGFGPVAKSAKELVGHVEAFLDGTHRMKDTYRRRADDFFAYSGGGNSERVYEAIRASQQRRPVFRRIGGR